MKHITPTPGKMCFSFAIKKRPLPTAGAKPWILYVNLKCTHSRKLGALYQFVVRKPDRILNRRSFLLALVFTGLNRIQKCGTFFQTHIQYNVHDWVTFCPDGLLLQILSILSVLNMFHFLFLFLPIFGKFQSQAADSVKRFQFASQQNIDHF